MLIEQHLAASRQFLEDATTLGVEGYSHMGASEMVWGAVVQALEAVGHINAGNERGSLGNRSRHNLARTIGQRSLTQYFLAQNNLHGHFYKGHLPPQSYDESMQQGREYAAELLVIAESAAG